MLYKCKICEKEFKQKCHYTNHLNRIRPCVKLTKNLQQITSKYTKNINSVIIYMCVGVKGEAMSCFHFVKAV